MYHFIYKTTSTSGKYYIGRHSTNNLNDGYCGSGKWIRSIKDKSTLSREILEYCEEEDLFEREEFHISENLGKENCMNFNMSAVGFSTGKMNPACSDTERKKRSDRAKGNNNPAKREDVRMKMSLAQKGKPSCMKGKKMSDEGRKNISEARRGLKYSEEGKRKLSESRKKQYQEGRRDIPDFTGKTHSEETKKRMSESFHNREQKECPYCNKLFHPATYGRWHGDSCKMKKGE